MRFMMLMIPKGYQTPEPPAMPTAEMIAEMMKFNEELTKAGVLLGLDGLHPPASAARVHFSGTKSGKKPTVVDGPFAEAKEAVGGYWLLQVRSREEAIEWATRCPAFEGDVIEVRQVQEMSDFPEGSIPELSPELAKIGGQ